MNSVFQEQFAVRAGEAVDRRTKHLWLLSEVVGTVALVAACLFFDLNAYVVVASAFVAIGLISVGVWGAWKGH
jgi:hypothetical protein